MANVQEEALSEESYRKPPPPPPPPPRKAPPVVKVDPILGHPSAALSDVPLKSHRRVKTW